MPLSRTARALSATAFTTLVLGAAASAASASANPGAEVSPRTVAPGGSVTVSVTCASTGGHPPETIDATSEAFEHGTVQLHRTGHSGREDDPAGTDDPAGLGVEDPVGPGDVGPDDVGPPAVAEEPEGVDGLGGRDDPAGKEGPRGGDLTYSGTARIAPTADFEEGGGRASSEWRAEGVCPAAPGGEGKEWSASFTVSADGSHGTSHGDSHGTGVPHGVHAGEGGTFNESTAALVSGGVLIVGALGAAAHRLRHRDSSVDG
ncbi:hypothetical protein [Streptomyces liliiviolaceus]|uniref:hypothetical protein n=1 Tax=Streptomyces liliiviolaceus TaxID=2823109 RepID=UPI001FFDAA44|nr:hypothetical protein [Streptomyces liliiviolaceus]